jgi:cobalt-zinc-cadmium efflux system protein
MLHILKISTGIMGHDHSHHHHHHGNGHSTKNIVVAFWLNTFFALLEIAGGLYTNSVAILSDALHDLGDSLSLGLSWYFHKKSQQKRDISFSYGYRRFSLLGALINSSILVIGSIFILQEAVSRLGKPQQPDTTGMLVLAVAGIVVNGVAMLRLKKGGSLNERIVSLHFLEDVLGWAAVLAGSIVMMFFDVPILDPLLSMGIALFILFNVYKNLKSLLRIILQGVPENVNEAEIVNKVTAIKGVEGVHDLHAWSLDGQYNILTLHLVLNERTTFHEIENIKNEVRHCLEHLHLNHITIETEASHTRCALEHC